MIRRTTLALMSMLCLLSSTPLLAQSTNSVAPTSQQANQQKAHALLAATIEALGGPAWINVRTGRAKARTALFFLGAPTGNTFTGTETTESPDKDRLDIPKQHVIQMFSGECGWEITYKGKRKLSQQECDKYQRLRGHSIGKVLHDWYSNPATVLIDEGPSQVNRRVTEKIKLINPANDAVTLEIDAESHLPLQLSFEWRDPRFQDKSLETIEYDNYHTVDGIATPFTVTEIQNGGVTRETYFKKIQYNIKLPRDFFDPDIAAKHLK